LPRPRPTLFSALLCASFLHGIPAVAGPDLTTMVEVPGFGSVHIEAARATCTNGTGIGALAEPGEGRRVAALVEWGRNRLAAGTDGSWPQRERDLTYTDVEVPWVPRGVVTSCWAVARHDIARGLELRALCDKDRTACRDSFAESDREAVAVALKGKVRDRKDEMFAQLATLPDLSSWHSPADALERACTWPQQAAAAGRFVDTDDLAAARSACVQALELLTGEAAARVGAMPCAGAWGQVPADVQPTPDTDLGMIHIVKVASSEDVELAKIADKLTRMNPGAGCDVAAMPADQQSLALAFGTTWTSGLAKVFAEAQTTRACLDDSLPLAERLALCPTLVAGSDASCHRGDRTACDLLARLHLEGVGVPADEEAAFDVWQESCNASHGAACDALLERKDRIQEWLDAALDRARDLAASTAPAAGPPPEVPSLEQAPGADPFVTANGLMARFGSALGPEWVSESAKALFDAAVAAEREKEANDILTIYGSTLSEEWENAARTRLGALQELLKKRSAK
jgi:hypothetical protein